jgi:hypothetical protein
LTLWLRSASQAMMRTGMPPAESGQGKIYVVALTAAGAVEFGRQTASDESDA